MSAYRARDVQPGDAIALIEQGLRDTTVVVLDVDVRWDDVYRIRWAAWEKGGAFLAPRVCMLREEECFATGILCRVQSTTST